MAALEGFKTIKGVILNVRLNWRNSSMVFSEGVLGILLEPLLKLKNWWDKREKRKGIKEQLLHALDIDR